MRVRCSSLLLLLLAAGCRQLLGFEQVAEVPADGVEPDTTPVMCETLFSECASETVLRTCVTVGELAVDTSCPWGCLAGDGREPHCGALAPSGGAVVAADLLPDPALESIAISVPTLIDAETGLIITLQGVVRAAGTGVISGIGFDSRAGVGVFRFAELRVQATLAVSGNQAIALVAPGAIEIDEVIDARAHDNIGTVCPDGVASPGGFAGGNAGQDGSGPGAGIRGQGAANGSSGGGGGGHGAIGGRGGDGNGRPGGASGGASGDPMLAAIASAGGSGGGGGGTDGGGAGQGIGGAGGGAIQLVSNEAIRLLSNGGINAGGCRGLEGNAEDGGGGGGGAGGAILIETPILEIGLLGAMVGLAVNGGGGGAGGGAGATNGTNALLAPMPAAGGSSIQSNGGGDGGAVILVGQDGGDSGNNNGGGGGGAVGRIRIHTRTGMIELGALGFLSPSTAMPTTSTIATPTVD